MTIHEAQQQLLFQLYHIYDNSESQQIADLVMEHLTGWKRIDRVMNKQLPMLLHQSQTLEHFTEQLLSHKPVQYVLGESWFAGMKLYVDEAVLIPRPETEELVDWVVKDHRQHLNSKSPARSFLDIGTGSGCIALALKKYLPFANLTAIDISEQALQVAERNAHQLQLPIELLKCDILSKDESASLGCFDCIISNPPYIPLRDKESMRNNVLDYEPWQALFVQDDDPISYYRAIASFGNEHLMNGGAIYLEIHEQLAADVSAVMTMQGYTHVEIRKDMQGKDRMIKAW